MQLDLKKFWGSKLGSDLVWNLGSFVVLGSAGLLINIIIAQFYDAGVLGVFNQVFMFYVVMSQFSVFGLQFSALRSTSEQVIAPNSQSELAVQAYAAILLAIGLAIVTSLLFAFLIPAISDLFDSKPLERGLWFGLLGIGLFAVNKVILAVVNGLREMRAFAVLQSIRYISMLGFVVFCIYAELDGVFVCLSLAFAEVLVFTLSLIFLAKRLPYQYEGTMTWVRKHVLFGFQSVLSGAVSELNTRVDIAMLGAFVSDARVGVYSFAAIFVEGLAQLSVVVRNIINPMATQFYSRGELEELAAFSRRVRNWFYLVMGCVIAIAVVVFPYVVQYVTNDSVFEDSIFVFQILGIGLVMCAGYLPLEMYLVQTGHPIAQTQLRLAVLSSNIALNYLLIPKFELAGAAIATSFSYLIGVLLIRVYAKRQIGINI